MRFRALNYTANIASRLGKRPEKLAIIDRALANAGLRRKGTGRSTPAPTLEEQLMLILAATTASAPLSWASDRKEPTVKECADEASLWFELPSAAESGEHLARFSRGTFGETLVAIVSNMSLQEFEKYPDLQIRLNLTTELAEIQLSSERECQREHLSFGRSGRSNLVEAQTVVEISGSLLRYFAFELASAKQA
ncbi:hypothetical protein DSM110093_01989 [Sulfitobacter sp. DSM 110093]|uniref:hypothetical protein n=1 Tax=Sulfitobacter sp. DSM 110093 TaxID=2883127 RepID=UPI001FAC6908|nr:hypothetical protein [Sulfitobacter sp. DSM 110093]UOA32204.1 hypothetical protein DSM110093_01989 [Sulfitobacter sp. DSM 110093]